MLLFKSLQFTKNFCCILFNNLTKQSKLKKNVKPVFLLHVLPIISTVRRCLCPLKTKIQTNYV
jgi:hypothetical protein